MFISTPGNFQRGDAPARDIAPSAGVEIAILSSSAGAAHVQSAVSTANHACGSSVGVVCAVGKALAVWVTSCQVPPASRKSGDAGQPGARPRWLRNQRPLPQRPAPRGKSSAHTPTFENSSARRLQTRLSAQPPRPPESPVPTREAAISCKNDEAVRFRRRGYFAPTSWRSQQPRMAGHLARCKG